MPPPMAPRPDIIISPTLPSPVPCDADEPEGWICANDSVRVPRISIDDPNDIGTPLAVTAGAPGVRVVPPIAISLAPRAKVSLPIVMYVAGELLGAVGKRRSVLLPITRAEEPREIGVPETEMGVAPGRRLVLPKANPLGFAVYIWPAIEKVGCGCGCGGGEGREMVLAPIIIFDDASEIGVPEMETPGPPGRRVLSPIETPDGFAV